MCFVQITRFDAYEFTVRPYPENDGALSFVRVYHAANAFETLALKRERLLSLEDLRFGPTDQDLHSFFSHWPTTVKGNWENERIDPEGIRTPVAAVKGLCPGPLDDGATSPDGPATPA